MVEEGDDDAPTRLATMLRGALAAFGHGLLPCVLTANASRAVRDLHARLEMPRDALDGLRPSKTV